MLNQKEVTKKKIVVEYMMGCGRNTPLLDNYFEEVHLVERNKEMCEAAK